MFMRIKQPDMHINSKGYGNDARIGQGNGDGWRAGT